MKKKMISALLCVSMTATLFTGCGSSKKETEAPTEAPTEAAETEAPAETEAAETEAAETAAAAVEADGAEKYPEFITVDVYDQFANYQGMQTGWFAKVVKDKFNMELNIIAPNVAGGDTIFQTRSAAGDLGDLILTDTENGKLQNLITAGLMLDMTDLLKDKDVYLNYSDAITAVNSELVKEEGVWAIPNSISSSSADTPSEGLDLTYGPYLRWDYYKEIGYPEMETLEDMLDVLKQMQDAAGTTEDGKQIYAISLFKDWDDNMMNNAKQPCCFYGYDEIGFVLAKADGSDYQSIIDSDSMYVRVLKFFFQANQMGLVDPESTSQNYDTLSTKYQNGQILYAPWPWLGQSLYNTVEHKEAGTGFMLAPINDMQIFSYGCSVTGGSTRVIGIGTKAEDPERLADFIDWLYSPEGFEIGGQANGAAGPEGLTWEMVDGKPVRTEFGVSALPNNDVEVPEEWGGGTWKDGINALNFQTLSLVDIDPNTGEAYNWQMWESTLEANVTPLDTDWQEHMGATTTLEYLEANDMVLVAPGTNFASPEENSNISTIRNQCKSSIVDYSWKMIFAADEAEFDSLLAAMQENVNGLGYEEVLAVDMENAEAQQAAREAALALSGSSDDAEDADAETTEAAETEEASEAETTEAGSEAETTEAAETEEVSEAETTEAA
ncbi:MAG: ABC transporter substrate-binding protein [Eubacteriales bacterium]|nr:ABC transporter substrate-binding protein [Eubacteriales bacterium]